MAKKGSKCYTDGKQNIYISEGMEVPEGFYKGFAYKSDETLKNRVQKTAKTKLDRYGSETYNNSEKNKQTCLKNYGTENPMKSEKVKAKIRQTNLDKYGVENPFQSEEVKAKQKQTLLEKYGVEYIAQTESHKQKVSDFWKNISDDRLAEISAKKQKTCLERYGKQNIAQVPEFRTKLEETCIKRYGVPTYLMTEEVRLTTSNDSEPNKEFARKLTELGLDFDREYHIDRKSYDFICGDTLLEINPYATHNSTWGIFGRDPLDKKYHYEKTRLAKRNGFRCINIWDWDDEEKILSLLTPKSKIYARKCEIVEISSEASKEFLNSWHLQGNVRSDIRIALLYENQVVSLMTFGKSRYNKKYQYELLRYCSSKCVVGGSEKLFKYFLNTYKPESIISYCDLSKFTGDVYGKLGFTYKTYTIGKHWYNPKTQTHITDNLLRQRGFDQLLGKTYGCFGKGTSNEELMLQHGFVEIYDCGQATYTWSTE